MYNIWGYDGGSRISEKEGGGAFFFCFLTRKAGRGGVKQNTPKADFNIIKKFLKHTLRKYKRKGGGGGLWGPPPDFFKRK